jgi:GH18 family chitinase
MMIGKAFHSLKYAVLGTTLAVLSAADAPAQTKGLMVGYFGSWNAWSGYRASNVPWNNLTHVVFSFITPTPSGGINDFDGTEKAELPNIVSQAKSKGVKVLVSVGGVNGSQNFPAMASNAGARSTFCNNIASYLNNNGLDGVDIDWEYPTSFTDSANYALLIKELRAKIGSKLLSAAVAGDNEKGQFIPRSALLTFDFLVIMAFDYTGSFVGSLKGQHSSFTHAKNGLLYWRSRGMTKDKGVVGIPQYGKNFNAGGTDMAYNTIVASYPNLPAATDEVNNIYFNGPGTVKAKATYVAEGSWGGCMFWELSQDRSGALVAAAKEGLKAQPIGVLPVLTPGSARRGARGLVSLSGMESGAFDHLTGPASRPSGLRDVLGRVPSPAQASAAGIFMLPSAAPQAAPAR